MRERVHSSNRSVTVSERNRQPAASAAEATILIVDDDARIVSLLKETLEQEGYETLLAGNANAALRICEQSPHGIHLLIADLLMPGMNGLEMVTKALAVCPEIKVLYISENSTLADAFESEQGIPFLEKPFSVSVLLNTVRNLLTPQRETNPLPPRKYTRIRLGWPITYSGQEIAGGGILLDLSIGGCAVEGEEHVPYGTEVELRIALPGHDSPIAVRRARVRWSLGRKFGTEFVRMETKDHERLRRILGSHFSQPST